ncbi:MAG: hypothetical protein GWN16_13475, partial [Calditrichae bacterium]|nr:hypothetical protein [Calditrichia bacterium]NIV71314.1 hypothetical protein [Calditrichia bacterium]NIW80393.1 hypothetical protein [Calditrichia bacterium]
MKNICLYLWASFGILLIASVHVAADDIKDITYLSSEKLKQSDLKLIWLADNWRYHAGDDSAWANPDHDDSGWESVHPAL